MQFSHLHCHTQYSLLDGQANIKKLLQKAKNDNMPAVAITDHGNMFGVFEFVAEAAKQGIKPSYCGRFWPRLSMCLQLFF